jgi:hypothetical protein
MFCDYPTQKCSIIPRHTHPLRLEGSQLPIPHAPLAVVWSCPIEPKNKLPDYPNYMAKWSWEKKLSFSGPTLSVPTPLFFFFPDPFVCLSDPSPIPTCPPPARMSLLFFEFFFFCFGGGTREGAMSLFANKLLPMTFMVILETSPLKKKIVGKYEIIWWTSL